MKYSLDIEESPEAWREKAGALGTWQQRARLGDNIFTPGLWHSWDIAKVLLAEFPEEWWEGKRVLDIGANCGGLSLELARLGANVVAAEPYGPYREKIEWLKETLSVPDEVITVTDQELFQIDTNQSFDLVLCLGLVYHFRHPQLVLDYVGNFDADHFVFSTQTFKDDRDVMINRSEVTPQYLEGHPLGGWHFTRQLFLKMMAWAGMENPRAIEHFFVKHDWGERQQTTTNSAYFVGDRGEPVDYRAEAVRFI